MSLFVSIKWKWVVIKIGCQYLLLCSAEDILSYRFGTTWSWLNDDRICIFGWHFFFSLTESTIVLCLYIWAKAQKEDRLLPFRLCPVFRQNVQCSCSLWMGIWSISQKDSTVQRPCWMRSCAVCLAVLAGHVCGVCAH